MELLLQWRDCGRCRTTEIQYDADQHDEFVADVARYMQLLDDERHGRIRGDAPILTDVLAIA